MRIFSVFCLLAISLIAPSAFAQENGDATSGTEERCRAAPNDQNGAANGSQQKPLTDTLEDCRGVLAPPPTGDGDISAPPPEGGKTPVITPPELPEQQPSN